jgi:uncharacterized protein (DUF58 family)
MKRWAAVALGGLALTLIAYTFAAAPLLVAGLAFMALGTTVPVWVALSARASRLERRLSADRVLEGEPLEATLTISCGRLGLPGAAVIDPLSAHPVSLEGTLSLIGGSRSAQVRMVTRFPRRGLLHLDPPRLVIADALELATTIRPGSSPAEDLLVLPRTEKVKWASRDGIARGERHGARANAEPMAAVDVDGLRPYRPGTPASRIHWPALARGAGLLERRLQPDNELRPLIVLDSRHDGAPERLDAAVRAAASLVLELGRGRGCSLLLPGERRAQTIEPELTGWPAAHARLAMVEGGPRARAPMLVAGARPGPVVYIAAQPIERLPAGLAGLGSGARVLVLPKEASDRAGLVPSFEVSGCYGFVLRARGSWAKRSAAA